MEAVAASHPHNIELPDMHYHGDCDEETSCDEDTSCDVMPPLAATATLVASLRAVSETG